MLLLTLLLTCSSLGSSYKFLVYSPQYFYSPVKFMSRLADALVDEGHEVVMVSPRTDTTVGSPKTKARVLEVRQAPKAVAMQEIMNSAEGGLNSIWNSPDIFTQINGYYPLYAMWVDQCEVTLDDQDLIDLLRKEHFDAGFTEPCDSCGYALFHLLGIKKYATVYSMATFDGYFHISQVPFNPAYMPSMMGGSAGDRMTFYERLHNTLVYLKMNACLEHLENLYQSLFDRIMENTPNLRKLKRNSSLVFMNSDPLADFPKLTSSRVIDIGGISVHAGHNELDKYWSSVLSRRNHTIFISFGTFVKAHLMPAAYKDTIRETARKFPNVTFIWKYEKPEHNISHGIDNLVETVWAPQNDLLHDKRLSAFITHGGQGSVTESASAGIPLISIPVTVDQFRNSRQVERSGVGIMLAKDDLERTGPLGDAIEKIIRNKRFKANAVTLSEMFAERPFTMKEVFVRNMEFLAKFGPHRRFDHYGAQLNFVQYYLIDVFGFLALLAISVLFVALYSLKIVVNHFSSYSIFKTMKIE